MALFSVPAGAEIYKWTDEKGQIHYSDKKPVGEAFAEVPEGAEVKGIGGQVSTYESVSYDTSAVDAGKKVVIFSASWCGACKKAKKYFRRNAIPFTEYDIEKGSKAKRLYKQLGATGVPVIIVGKRRMNGFTEAGFKRIYR